MDKHKFIMAHVSKDKDKQISQNDYPGSYSLERLAQTIFTYRYLCVQDSTLRYTLSSKIERLVHIPVTNGR